MWLQIGYSPLSPFLASGDSKGVRTAASCVESISCELIDSKEFGEWARGGAPSPLSSKTSHGDTYSK